MIGTVKAARSPLEVMQAGYGAFGAVHARAWRRHGSAVRLTIAETSAARREIAARECPDASIIAALPATLGAFDAVDIVTPADTHASIAINALRSGCNLLIEKPFVLNSTEAKQVEAVAQSAGSLVQVGYFYRSHPVAVALRDRLRAEPQDRPIWIDADFTSLKRPRADAGVVDNDAVHFIDLACWLVGAPPRDVTAILRHPLDRRLEDIALVVLAWPDGMVARIQSSCVIAGPEPDPVVPGGWSRKSVTVTTRARQLTADLMADSLTERAARLDRLADDTWRTCVDAPKVTGFGAIGTDDVVAAEIASFVAAIRERTPSIADLQSGVAMVEICDALRRSAREGRTVAIAEAR